MLGSQLEAELDRLATHRLIEATRYLPQQREHKRLMEEAKTLEEAARWIGKAVGYIARTRNEEQGRVRSQVEARPSGNGP